MTMPSKPLDTTYAPYSNGIEPESIQLPEDNDPVDSENNAMFKKKHY